MTVSAVLGPCKTPLTICPPLNVPLNVCMLCDDAAEPGGG
jgi:hypothetical protein